MNTAIDILLGVFIGFAALLFISYLSSKRKKLPVSTLYLKRYPDGTKAFRLGLRLDLNTVVPGDKFEVVVQEESPTDTDIMIYNNVKEDQNGRY